jgi:hypothetical protein
MRDLPAGLEPEELRSPRPATERRSRLRRRTRYLRRVRELLLRDLGGLVYEIHRAAGGDRAHHEALVRAKAERIAALDGELFALEASLGSGHPENVLREPGVGGACPACGELHGSDARFCSACGRPLTGRAAAQAAAAGDLAERPAEREAGAAEPEATPAERDEAARVERAAARHGLPVERDEAARVDREAAPVERDEAAHADGETGAVAPDEAPTVVEPPTDTPDDRSVRFASNGRSEGSTSDLTPAERPS